MGSFDLPVEMRAGLLYVNVPDTKVFAMPMELGFKFVAIIGLDGVYPKGEFVADIVNKGYGTLCKSPQKSYSFEVAKIV
jgi:hypothetical protein